MGYRLESIFVNKIDILGENIEFQAVHVVEALALLGNCSLCFLTFLNPIPCGVSLFRRLYRQMGIALVFQWCFLTRATIGTLLYVSLRQLVSPLFSQFVCFCFSKLILGYF